ncbi:EAL domain-containing protein [Arthrobacter sp. CAU 1506]|uniref:putative bifunctional diguanylate cyclase/phosphodiesterase n=1 Tax=Arthrobacter sp. CAU 1506 TaxID=2560052 RepID=UPI0010ABB8A9|nr:bifunctional diguanylate cyclase/phosphodiesterase [Arthrobacter sp. CAU 1506]TJY69860.1 EAL domain-containing protein [Arthrobacter sp. CAU 1506]
MDARTYAADRPRADRPQRVGELGQKVPVVAADTLIMEVNGWFQADRSLQAVAVEADGGHWLLLRERLESELSGRLGYGRALNSRTRVGQLRPEHSFAVAPELSMTQAARRILSRPPGARYEDFLVVGPDGPRVVAVSRIFEEVSALFQHDAMHDPLTGLPNRRLLDERGAELVGDCDPGRVAILCIDLDRFKHVNDTFGHRAGDSILTGFTGRLQRTVRGRDIVARLGGDEFAVLLVDVDAEQARSIADRILAEAVKPFPFDDHELHISASIGLALASDVVEEEQLSQLDVLLRQADGAMLAAKQAGKGRVVWLSARGETAPVARQAQLRRRLQLAVAAGGFRLHYQPLLNLGTGGGMAVEALLRWHDDVLGPVPPSEFIPVAESVNLIQQIGRWVFNEACAQAGAWLAAGSPRTVSINVSPIQLAANKVVGELLAAMAAHRVPAELIRVEITESSAIADFPRAIKQLAQLREAGIGVDLDDFGTGYSSVGMLRDLPLNTVKIDKSFIDNIDSSEREAAFVGGLINIAHAWGLKVTAEGVERPEQLEVLRELGCDTAQGYYISRPASASDLPGAQTLAALQRPQPAVVL